MVGHGGSSAGSYLADPTSPIPSHCASIVVTSTVRVNITFKVHLFTVLLVLVYYILSINSLCLQVLPFDDNLCVREPCLNYEECLTILKFGNASSFVDSPTMLFRPIQPINAFRCQCPTGFTGELNGRLFHTCIWG